MDQPKNWGPKLYGLVPGLGAGPVQPGLCTLLKACHTLDAILTANEADDCLEERKAEVICKFDTEEAYDHGSWEFLMYV